MGLLHLNLSLPVLVKILEKRPPSTAIPGIKAVRKSIPLCALQHISVCSGRSTECSSTSILWNGNVLVVWNLWKHQSVSVYFCRHQPCLLYQHKYIFFLNELSLLVYTRDGTHCLNLGFVSSTYIKPQHFCLCLLPMDRVVLAGSGDTYTLPGNMGRGKEHCRREKPSHLQQNSQVLWRSALVCINHVHKTKLKSSILVLSHRR